MLHNILLQENGKLWKLSKAQQSWFTQNYSLWKVFNVFVNLLEIKMNIDSTNWFKFNFNIFGDGDKHCRSSSSYFDKNIFVWQKIAWKSYLLTNNWMITTRKELPYILLKIKSNNDDLTHLYFVVRGIIEELPCACYFDNTENLIEAIISRDFTSTWCLWLLSRFIKKN